MISKVLHLKTVGESMLEILAQHISRLLVDGDIVALKGDLGTGKTSFVRYMINALSPGEPVDSPTFCIMKPYGCKRFNIWHLDLYRIKTVEEAFELGVFEIVKDGVAFIEWPEVLGDVIQPTFYFDFTYIDESHREIKMTANRAITDDKFLTFVSCHQ